MVQLHLLYWDIERHLCNGSVAIQMQARNYYNIMNAIKPLSAKYL